MGHKDDVLMDRKVRFFRKENVTYMKQVMKERK